MRCKYSKKNAHKENEGECFQIVNVVNIPKVLSKRQVTHPLLLHISAILWLPKSVWLSLF